MATTRNLSEKKEDQLSLQSETKLYADDESPLSYMGESDVEDEIDLDGEIKSPSTDVLTLCRENNLVALKLLLKDLEQKRITVEELRKKFSIQSEDEKYKGTNAVWWLVCHEHQSHDALKLFCKFVKKEVITSEQLSQQCQGTHYTGVNALFWIVCKYGSIHHRQLKISEGHSVDINDVGYNPLRYLALYGFITEEHLKALFTGNSSFFDFYDIEQYQGFNVVDILISKKSSHIFLMLLEKERWDQSKPLTSAVLTDRISDLLNDSNLSDKQASEYQDVILALHMMLVTKGRSLNLNSSHSRAANIIREFDNHVLNLLMGSLPSPIRDVAIDPVLGKANDAAGIRTIEDPLFENILLNNIFNVKGPKIHFYTKSLALLPLSVISISQLSFFKTYIQRHLLPIAKQNLLEESKNSFVNNTAKLVRESIIELPGGWKVLNKELMENFKEVMKLALDRYFKQYPYNVIARDMQKKITAEIMACITIEISSGTPKFNPTFVLDTIVRITNSKTNIADEKPKELFSYRRG